MGVEFVAGRVLEGVGIAAVDGRVEHEVAAAGEHGGNAARRAFERGRTLVGHEDEAGGMIQDAGLDRRIHRGAHAAEKMQVTVGVVTQRAAMPALAPTRPGVEQPQVLPVGPGPVRAAESDDSLRHVVHGRLVRHAELVTVRLRAFAPALHLGEPVRVRLEQRAAVGLRPVGIEDAFQHMAAGDIPEPELAHQRSGPRMIRARVEPVARHPPEKIGRLHAHEFDMEAAEQRKIRRRGQIPTGQRQVGPLHRRDLAIGSGGLPAPAKFAEPGVGGVEHALAAAAGEHEQWQTGMRQ